MIGRALLAGVVITLLAALFAFKASQKMPDFEVYWRAGARAMVAEPLYPAEDEHYQLKYLPAFGVLAIPAAMLPMPAAKAVWFTLSAALVVALLALSLGLLPARRKAPWVLIALTTVAMAKFYGHELVLGQVNLLFGVVVLAGVRLVMRQRPVPSGVMVSLAVALKPYAIIFVPWLGAHSRRAVLAAAAGIAVAVALPIVFYGFAGTVDLHRDWWLTVTQSTPPNLLNADNVSLAGMYAKWLGIGPAAAAMATVTSLALLGAAALVVSARARVPSPIGLEAALLLTLIPLISPQGWDYLFLLSTPAVMYLLNYERDLPTPGRVVVWLALATIAFSIYDVMGRRAYAAFMAWSIVSVCYLAVVGVLVALRLRRVA